MSSRRRRREKNRKAKMAAAAAANKQSMADKKAAFMKNVQRDQRRMKWPPEMAMKWLLDQAGIEHRHQYIIKSYCLDFMLPWCHLVIEVDGAHHRADKKRRKADRKRDQDLVENHKIHQVLRFPSVDVMRAAEGDGKLRLKIMGAIYDAVTTHHDREWDMNHIPPRATWKQTRWPKAWGKKQLTPLTAPPLGSTNGHTPKGAQP